MHRRDGEGEERKEKRWPRSRPVIMDRISEIRRREKPSDAHQEVKPWIGWTSGCWQTSIAWG